MLRTAPGCQLDAKWFWSVIEVDPAMTATWFAGPPPDQVTVTESVPEPVTLTPVTGCGTEAVVVRVTVALVAGAGRRRSGARRARRHGGVVRDAVRETGDEGRMRGRRHLLGDRAGAVAPDRDRVRRRIRDAVPADRDRFVAGDHADGRPGQRRGVGAGRHDQERDGEQERQHDGRAAGDGDASEALVGVPFRLSGVGTGRVWAHVVSPQKRMQASTSEHAASAGRTGHPRMGPAVSAFGEARRDATYRRDMRGSRA